MVTSDMTFDDDSWSTEELDDDSWSIEEIAKLCYGAAKLAGYSNSDIAYCLKKASRQRMLAELDGLRKHGWICFTEPFDPRNVVKITFCSLSIISSAQRCLISSST